MTGAERSLTLDQIHVFLSVVDTGSFSEAARQLRRAQSAVSYAIANLERLLDLELFDRRSNRVALTAEGESLLDAARDLVAQADRLVREAEAVRDGNAAELRVAVDGFIPMTSVARAMRALRREFPASTIALRSESLGAVPELLMNGRVDIALSPLLNQHSERIDTEALLKVEMLSVAAPDIDPANQPQIVIRDRTRLTENLSYGVVSGSQYHVADAHTKLELLLLGLGWGMFPRELIEPHLEDGRLQILDTPDVPAPVDIQHYVGWRRDATLGRVGQRFVELLRELTDC